MFTFRNLLRLVVLVIALLSSAGLLSAAQAASLEQKTINVADASLSDNVRETYPFAGLANYYESVAYFHYSNGRLNSLKEGKSAVLLAEDELILVGRFDVAIISDVEATVTITDNEVVFSAIKTTAPTVIKLTQKDQINHDIPHLEKIRYSHLWGPFKYLSKLADYSIAKLQSLTGLGWAWTVILFCILVKLLLIPVNLFTVRAQRRVSSTQAALEQRLDEIKKTLKGEEAHSAYLQAHRDINVSTFYSLKPLVGSFVQVPILIAVFNALGEMPQFRKQSFFWVKDIAYPDNIGSIRVSIPMMGDTVSLLPILMTVVTIGSTIFFKNQIASLREVSRQKLNLYLMAFAFFILFYPFPAVMVLYWTVSNILQFIQQKIVKI